MTIEHTGRRGHEQIGAHEPAEIGEREEEGALAAVEMLARDRVHRARLARDGKRLLAAVSRSTGTAPTMIAM